MPFRTAAPRSCRSTYREKRSRRSSSRERRQRLRQWRRSLQARLRYEFKPLSDLFVVYSYGGSFFAGEETGWNDLVDQSIDNPAAHQLLFKLSYRF